MPRRPHRQAIRLAFFLLATAAVAGCSGGSAPNPTDLPPPTPASPPTAPPLGASPTPTNEGGLPQGLGFVEPTFTLSLETPLEDLPSGTLLLVLDLESLESGPEVLVSYVDPLSGARGALFVISAVEGEAGFPGPLTVDGDRVYLELVDPPRVRGVLELHLASGSLRQFEYGADGSCRPPNGRGYLQDGQLGFHCEDSAGILTWHVFSFAEGEFLTNQVLPEGVRMRRWTDEGAAEFGAIYDSSEAEFPFCLAEPPDWRLDCSQLPYWVGGMGPEDELAWVRAADETASLGVIDAVCLAGEPCEFFSAAPPEGWEEAIYGDLFSAAWTPDGSSFVALNADCLGENLTRMWEFDLDSGESSQLASLPGCYTLPGDGGIWDAESAWIAVETGEAEAPPLTVFLDGSSDPLPLALNGVVIGALDRP